MSQLSKNLINSAFVFSAAIVISIASLFAVKFHTQLTILEPTRKELLKNSQTYKKTQPLIESINKMNKENLHWELADFEVTPRKKKGHSYINPNVEELYINGFQNRIRLPSDSNWETVTISIVTKRYNSLLLVIFFLSLPLAYFSSRRLRL